MKLYTYFRSSAAFRVRIVLGLKGIDWTPAYVHMLRNGGEQHSPAYRAVNPLGLVPALDDGGLALTQSPAICEYLEETHPEPALLPKDPKDRAYIRAVMAAIACDIHPLNNLRVLKYITGPLKHSEEEKLAWYRHWIAEGLSGVEGMLATSGKAGAFSLGDAPTLADAFILPQLYNARRFNCPLEDYPTLLRVEASCLAHPAFQAAMPEAQGDAGS